MNTKGPVLGRLLVFAAGTALMMFCALSVITSAFVDGQYIPQNPDAFYHARRILDAVMSGDPVIQFDRFMHVPEGSWVTWPWAYDQVLAWVVSVFGPYTTEQDAARLLFHLPLAFVPVAIGLMVWLTWQLRLSVGMSALAVLSFAAVPFLFMQYAVGNVDHHFAEQLWVLMLLNGAVWMMRVPGSRVAPIFLGAVLGTGIAVQNGLFVLPVMMVLVLALAWVRGLELPHRGRLDALALSTLAVSVAVCIPSQPWRNGEFSYLLLSWFQLYVAAICAAYVIWIARARPTIHCTMTMAVVGVLVLIAAYVPVMSGMQFASGQSESIQNIAEAVSPYQAVSRLGPERSTRLFTWLVWLSLPAVLVNVWWVARSRMPGLVAFAGIGAILLLLMQTQVRFVALGMIPLVITLPLAVVELAAIRPGLGKIARLAIVLVVAVCFLPTKGIFRTLWVQGNDHSYAALRHNLRVLGEACSARPGTVVAPLDAGHWVRYHTKCSVVANVFVLSPQQVQKVQELSMLLEMTPSQLRESRPDVKYVIAYVDIAAALRAGLAQPTEEEIQGVLPYERELIRELLRTDQPLPEGFRQISAARTPKGGIYARIFEIIR